MQDPAQALHPIDPEPGVGSILDARYELLAHLATGGMGTVYRARHAHLRKDVAVKVLRPELSATPDLVERFRREAEIASALEHENIVRVNDFGRSDDGHLYIVMELLEGESLFDHLQQKVFLSPQEAVPILWQMCAGLEAAHAIGVVHRDLKPENVFLARSASGREVAKILDFGIAKITAPSSGSATQAGMVVGTPEYLSPEQAMGGTVDARADVYSVGLIAWRMLVGRHPFKADDPLGLLMMQATQPVPPLVEQRPDLAEWPALVSAVMRSCAKDRTQRPEAAVLKDELASALGPTFIPPSSPTPPRLLPPNQAWTRSGDLCSSERPTGTPVLTLAPDPSEQRTPVKRLARSWAEAVRLGRTARNAGIRLRTTGMGLKRWVAARIRESPGFAVGIVGATVVAVALVVLTMWQHRRPATDARKLLGTGNAAQARALLDAARLRRPNDRELLLLSGRALHRIPGAVSEGIDAYQAARAVGPLEADALHDLAGDLGREQSIADRASRLLRAAGEAAIPPLLAASGEGAGIQRLRALTLLRDLGAEERVDRTQAYGRLLGDVDCDVRRSAARRLGEMGDPGALSELRNAAQAKVERKGFLGIGTRSSPACGAPEAAEAARRIEAARSASSY